MTRDEWKYLNRTWTQYLEDAQTDSNNVSCMFHLKEASCHDKRCPFFHSFVAPEKLGDAVRRMNGKPKK